MNLRSKLTLHPYSPLPFCFKCGCRECEVNYCAGNPPSYWFCEFGREGLNYREHLHVECVKCKFSFMMEVKDYEGSSGEEVRSAALLPPEIPASREREKEAQESVADYPLPALRGSGKGERKIKRSKSKNKK